MKEPIRRRWITAEETAAYLGKSTDFIRKLREAGLLKAYRVRNTFFYSLADVDRMIERGRIV